MLHFFYPIDARFFHEHIQPVLGQAWSESSFEPSRALCTEMLPRVRAYHESSHDLAEKSLVEQQAFTRLTFDRHIWRALVGEIMLFAAEELPLVQIAAESLCCLLAPETVGADVPRERFTPIHQVLFGARDLRFGGAFYRPDTAGCNELEDVGRLLDFLRSVRPESWTPQNLAKLADLPSEEDRAEELAFVRQEWPKLVEIYHKARAGKQVIVCEA